MNEFIELKKGNLFHTCKIDNLLEILLVLETFEPNVQIVIGKQLLFVGEFTAEYFLQTLSIQDFINEKRKQL